MFRYSNTVLRHDDADARQDDAMLLRQLRGCRLLPGMPLRLSMAAPSMILRHFA